MGPRDVTTRVALLLALAALLPLTAFGVWSMVTLQRDAREALVAANLRLAAHEAEDINQQVVSKGVLLQALSIDIDAVLRDEAQTARIVNHFVERFGEFREVAVFDADGRLVAAAPAGGNLAAMAGWLGTVGEGLLTPPARVADDFELTSRLTVPLGDAVRRGWIVAEVSQDSLRQSVRNIHVGRGGYALLAAPDGRLLAAGAPEDAPDTPSMIVATGTRRAPLLASQSATWRLYGGGRGETLLAVAAPIASLGWSLVIEQPVGEVSVAASHLGHQLVIAAIAVLAIAVGGGVVAGRRLVAPARTLERATEALAAGDLATRVDVTGTDEFGRLARSFNTMADRLTAMQDDARSRERQIMFGRVVAGLFHDLSHPIQNIANNARLMLHDDLDAETRASLQATVDREIATLRRFMDDVLNVAQPRPLERRAVDANTGVAGVVDAMQAEAGRAGVALSARATSAPAVIDADPFALGRVLSNLVVNAIQATAPGGRVEVSVTRSVSAVEIQVTDTGTGIPADRLSAIFDGLVTTRRQGLGLGLATSRRLVEQMGGSIAAQSNVGRGSTFTVRFPASSASV